ncbi:hypothetical protein KIH77_01840 [Bifidobacterium sp. 82T24]|uniref:DUF6625 family protein n=1 Tax=Bifidobacterium pluvialisilvae TaxID=2834436 RepID=UPI001C56346A|nr:DUF6625 family protein [Bifidobacterium pluvialisilvae]MBW3087486.1 hypothetical protein [Bifidobacterium pluvialisilvae]
MRTCAFILPYYGRFPEYFPVFLRSCAANPDFDWLIFTDDHTDYDYPANVHVHYETFADMQQRVRSAFDFHPQLRTPYKLCDLKPMYGYLFERYLADYRFWGHCDCDVVFGRLSHFITDELLERYDKIFPLGHLSLYRNTEENNRRFMLPLDGDPLYRRVLESETIFTFDESYLPTNVNRIYQENGFPIYMTDLSGNTSVRSLTFAITRYDDGLGSYLVEKPVHAIYIWDDGRLSRYRRRFGRLETDELMYMHFQRRRMRLGDGVIGSSRFKILPGSFETLEAERITNDNFSSIRWKRDGDLRHHRRSLWRGDIIFRLRRIRDIISRKGRA